jgi:DNA-binding NtrC family response regulator
LIKYARRYGTPARRLDSGAVDRLMAHDWPGNVRELRNVIEQTALFAPNECVAADEIQLGQGRIERRPKGRLHEVPPPAPPAPVHAPAAPAPIDEAAMPADFTPTPSVRSPIVAPRSPSSPPPPIVSSVHDLAAQSAAGLPASSSPSAALAPRPATDAADVEPPRADADREHPLVLRLPVGTRLADAERKLILLTLEAVRGNKQRAARVLGISRRGLYSKLQAYGEHVGAQEAPEAPVDSTDEPVSMSEPTVNLDADAPVSIPDVETPPLSEESPHTALHEDETPQAECPG